MARIDLDLAHAYRANPQRDEDYALLPLKMSFEDGGAYALRVGAVGVGQVEVNARHVSAGRVGLVGPAPPANRPVRRRCRPLPGSGAA